MKRDEGLFSVRVAYMVNQYPKVSHSFIRREIQALEAQGIEIARFAARGWRDELVDEEDLRERDKTRYLLREGISGLFMAMLRTLMTAPKRFFASFALALRMGKRSDRSWLLHLVYFAEACYLALRLQTAGVQHLHAHFGTNSAEVAMLAHVLCGIPYSFTVHGPEEFDKPEFIGLAEKISHAVFVVAISSYGRSQLFRWIAQDQWHKVKVVHCGLEKTFYNVPLSSPAAAPRLVCVGRLCEQKGQLLLIEAAAILAKNGFDFELVLAGDGEMRGAVEAAIIRNGLKQRVHITGWVSSSRVRTEILAAKALVLPSFAEGLPVVVMEAMALQRPVLSTYVAGIPELVIPGENGWLFPAGSVEDLAATMAQCLETPAPELARMGSRARQRVLVRHDIELEAIKLSRLFHEVILENTGQVRVS